MTPFDLRRLAVEPGAPVADSELPLVGIAIPHLCGRHQLDRCLASIARARYPSERLTVAVVDNGSGHAARLAHAHPGLRVIQNGRNEGFARASNAGARAVRDRGARVVVFLNDDVAIEPDFLRELVGPIVRGECAATGGMLLAPDGTLDHAGGGTNLCGTAIAWGWRQQPGPEHRFARRILFPSGGAMACDAEVFLSAGGFDEEFFAYYEDLDLGWRLWVLGHEVHYVPAAVGHHLHSATSARFPPESLRLLQARNPLLACFKNYARENLDRILPVLLALAARRAWVMARCPDARSFRIEEARVLRRPWQRLWARLRLTRPAGWRLPRLGAADFIGLNDFLGRWDHWVERREEVQARRARPDREIFELFLKPLWCVEGERGYAELQRGLLAHYGLDRVFEPLCVEGPDPRK